MSPGGGTGSVTGAVVSLDVGGFIVGVTVISRPVTNIQPDIVTAKIVPRTNNDKTNNVFFMLVVSLCGYDGVDAPYQPPISIV